MASTEDSVLFHEVQQFRQPWLWILLLFIALATLVCFGYGMIKQLVFGYSWGSRPLSNGVLAAVGTFFILFTVGLTYLFGIMKLIVEVRDDGLYLRFFPLSLQIIRFNTIADCRVCSYNPLKEFGGWGIRYGLKGKAYTVSGNRGVRLKLSKGKKLLIGSQQPEELARAIADRMKTGQEVCKANRL
jgi:hypothetical protein